MTGKFTLTIELGNEAMHTKKHLLRAVDQTMDRIRQTTDTEGRIRDINGNTVGHWKFEDES